MKVVGIWLTALAISAVPVGLLARRNAGSVLAGALVVALFVVYGLGALGVGGAGAGPTSDAGSVMMLWILVMAGLGYLRLIAFSPRNGSFSERIKWTGRGVR